MKCTLYAIDFGSNIRFIFQAKFTYCFTFNSSSASKLVGEQQLVDKEVVGQVSEASRRNHKVGSTERTGHLVSRLVVLAVLEQTLETERVVARKTLRLRECFHAYRTFRDVANLLRPLLCCGYGSATNPKTSETVICKALQIKTNWVNGHSFNGSHI